MDSEMSVKNVQINFVKYFSDPIDHGDIFWKCWFVRLVYICQSLFPGRFQHAKSESGVKHLEILHPDVEIKEKRSRSIFSYILFSSQLCFFECKKAVDGRRCKIGKSDISNFFKFAFFQFFDLWTIRAKLENSSAVQS